MIYDKDQSVPSDEQLIEIGIRIMWYLTIRVVVLAVAGITAFYFFWS